MSQVLHLEYACTRAERDEAQTLNLRQRLGRGSKWRTWLVLLLVVVGMALDLYFRMLKDIRLAYWPWIIGGVLGLAGIVFFIKRKLLDRISGTARLDVSETDITVLNAASNVSIPWSAFMQCIESPNLFVLVDRPKTTLIIVPKRAFPSESWQTWFREQTKLRVSSTEPVPTSSTAPTLLAGTNRLLLNFRFGFWDYVVRILASWRVRGLFVGIALLMGVTTIMLAINPPPDAVNSASKVFFVFELPFLLALFPFIILFVSFYTWVTHRKHYGPQDIVLSEESVAFSGRDGAGKLQWSAFRFFKETRWCFILWRGSLSLMLPKRALASREEIIRCRELLALHLKRSTWFLG